MTVHQCPAHRTQSSQCQNAKELIQPVGCSAVPPLFGGGSMASKCWRENMKDVKRVGGVGGFEKKKETVQLPDSHILKNCTCRHAYKQEM